MDVRLRSHLFAAACGPDLVLLDTALGRYDLAPGVAAHVRLDEDGQGLSFIDPDLQAQFAEAALLTDKVAGSISRPLPALPTRSALQASPRLTLADIGRHGRTWLHMRRVFNRASLPELIERVRVAEPAVTQAARQPEPSQVERRAAAFERMLAWTPSHGACVYRSYMLRRILQGDGVRGVQWVFGVRTWPFYAHCWLQRGEVSLTDYAEPLGAFVPIFAV